MMFTTTHVQRDRQAHSQRGQGEGRIDRMILGTPARFMLPRLVLVASVFALVMVGILMIFSASSITAMTGKSTSFDFTHYLQRQVLFAGIGVIAALVIVRVDYHVWSGLSARGVLYGIWVATLVLLLLVLTPFAGQDAYGASRWIMIGGFTLQPSEFAKLTVILTAANIMTRYFQDAEIDFSTFIKLMAAFVGIPLLFILIQPDKGTTMICAVTLVAMLYLAGFPGKICAAIIGAGVILFIALSLKDDYSRRRLMTLLDPWADPFGTSYQIVQGLYAFGSGGIFGVGIGMSRQKYSYLPFAYNDFIYAVVGEEMGLIGTLAVLATFVALVWAGFRIAQYAPDLTGRLIAAGCTSLIFIQFLVNVCGVLCCAPLTGKPVPFLSYGGSSIISCLMLTGLIGSVSRSSQLPETEFDVRRRGVRLADEGSTRGVPALSLVGEPTPRSQRQKSPTTPLNTGPLASSVRTRSPNSSARIDAARVTDADPTSPAAIRARRQLTERAGGRVSVDASGRRRIDLGPDAAARLRRGRESRR